MSGAPRMRTAAGAMTASPAADPAPRERRARPLERLNPITKAVAPLPAILLLVLVRDLATPAAFLALALLVLLLGARLDRRNLLFLAGAPLLVLTVGTSMSLWADASRFEGTATLLRLGGWTLTAGAVETGFATGLRLGAIMALALVSGLTTTGADLARAMVQQLRVPYRIGYTALAAFRFVPRFGHDLEVIRQAHRVRGAHPGRGPFAAIARGLGTVVPLLAGAIRHGERIALAMDARAFGAHPTRTERHRLRFGALDIGVVLLLLGGLGRPVPARAGADRLTASARSPRSTIPLDRRAVGPAPEGTP